MKAHYMRVFSAGVLWKQFNEYGISEAELPIDNFIVDERGDWYHKENPESIMICETALVPKEYLLLNMLMT